MGWTGKLTLPYLLKRVFRSVALVVEDRPLTHRFLLLVAAAPPPAATHTHDKLISICPLNLKSELEIVILHC